VIFAANRTPNEIALAPCEINSIITKKGANHKGAPAGINIAKKSNLWIWNPIIVQAKKILKLNPNVTTICDVGVNVYGTKPNIFINAKNTNNTKTNGKNLVLSSEDPIFSLTILCTVS